MEVSVVIATYGRTEPLIECLQSVERQFDPVEEVIVVDDGDIETTRTQIEQAGMDDIRLIEGPRGGLPAARNAGGVAATGDVICFIDDDVVLPPTWSRVLRETYEAFPEAAGVGGYVLNYNPSGINKANIETFGYRLLSAVRQVFFYDRIGEISPIGILYTPHTFMTAGPRRVDALQGCNMSFRAELLEEYGFDEWYGTTGSSACEELDFCTQIGQSHDLIYQPHLIVLHKRTLSGDHSDARTGVSYGDKANLAYFLLKHPDRGLSEFLLFVVSMLLYSALVRDLGHLLAIRTGLIAYWHRHREGP